MKKNLYVINFTNTFLEMKSHIKQSLITLDSIPDELKDFSKNIKNVNFQENNILKTVIMHEKRGFCKN